MAKSDFVYKRVVLKLSGEALAGHQGYGFDQKFLTDLSKTLVELKDEGLEIAIVVGGGNIWRGRMGPNMDRTTADHMGMLATTINSLALQDALEAQGAQVRVQTAIEMRQIAEPYIRRRAMRHLEKGRIVIFACGSGNPFFSTDTAAALRSAEIDADAFLKATTTDGIYTDDPKKNKNAHKYDYVSYKDFLAQELKVMDTTAVSLCMDNKIPVVVFGLDQLENIRTACLGKPVGTIIGE